MKYCRTKAQFLGCFKHSNASCHHQLHIISLSPPCVFLLRAVASEVNYRMGHSYNIASLLYCLLERTQKFFDIFCGVFVSILLATAHSPVKKPGCFERSGLCRHPGFRFSCCSRPRNRPYLKDICSLVEK